MDDVLLTGEHVRLEPLEHRHKKGLAMAAEDRSLYQWSLVPNGEDEVARYIETALAWKAASTALPFAIVRLTDSAVIGSTRFWNVEHWAWPKDHPAHDRGLPDGCEIGYTWLAAAAVRTGANTESKYLLLRHAFETWRVLRVCLHTDARNARSRAAIERMGGQYEGILRAHRMAADFTPRDSVRYSIVREEWPAVKARLRQFLERRKSDS